MFAQIMLLWLLQSPLAADRFAGVFQGEKLRVELKSVGGQYTGTIQLQGDAFPLIAKRQGNGIQGTFQTQGQSFAFQATLDDDTLTLTSDNTPYKLQREATVAAPPPAPVPIPAAAGKLHRTPAGLSFRTPDGWQVEHGPQASVMLPPGVQIDPNSENNAEVYMIASNTSLKDPNDPQFLKELQDQMAQSGAVVEKFDKEAFRTAKGPGAIFSWDIRGPKGQSLRFRTYLVRSANQTLALTAVGQREPLAARDPVLRQIASSLDLGSAANTAPPPAAAEAAEDPEAKDLRADTPLARGWDQRLRGKLLTQMSGNVGSSGGYTSEKRILLHADGRFDYYSSSLVTVDVPGASGSSGGTKDKTGRWRVVSRGEVPILELRPEGETTTYGALSYRDGKTFLGNVRTYVTDPK